MARDQEPASAATRERLRQRQATVIADLLAGRTPDGIDSRGASWTTRVLHRKRRTAALAIIPELVHLPSWRSRFDAWAAAHPPAGCAHDDVDCFLDSLDPVADKTWLRLHDLYDGRRRLCVARVDGRRVLAIGLGTGVRMLALRAPGPGADRGAGATLCEILGRIIPGPPERAGRTSS